MMRILVLLFMIDTMSFRQKSLICLGLLRIQVYPDGNLIGFGLLAKQRYKE